MRNTDGKIISIDEVPDGMSGLSCGCICTSCGRDLLACSLNGKVRRYFRHKGLTESLEVEGLRGNCNPVTANETALHQMAKQIIAEEKKVLVPQKFITLSEADVTDLPNHIVNEITPFVFQKAMLVEAESVEVERYLDNFTPDIYIKTKRGELFVEIYVSHPVDEIKKNKATEYGAAMLEIDLREYTQTPISSKSLRKIILYTEGNREWKYYPLSTGAIEKARNYYENLSIVTQYRKSVADEEQRKREQEQKTARRNLKIKHLFEPQIYALELNRLRNNDKFVEFWKNNREPNWFSFDEYYLKYQKVPFFIDIPITGEMIFKCDRRIWQSAIFNRYIYGRTKDNSSFNIEKIYDVLSSAFRIEVDFDLSYKLSNPLEENGFIHLRHHVVNKYMDYLETIGFIITLNRSKYCWKTVQAKKTIEAPNKNAADQLISALKFVDQYSPDIDRLIDERMIAYYEEIEKKKQEARARILAEQGQRILEEKQKKEAEKQEMLDRIPVRERIEQKQKYELGLQYVSSFDFSERINRYDQFGERWVRCARCNQIKRVDEMVEYRFGISIHT